MRQAIGLGIDRASIIKTVYGDLAGNTQPMNSMIYYSTQAAYKPDFATFNYSQSKALAMLKKHCTGGPCDCRCRWHLDLLRLPGAVPLDLDGR